MINFLIGSENEIKIQAFREVISEYPLRNTTVSYYDNHSDISKHPIDIEEIIQGAINRSKTNYLNNTYGVGIESGVFKAYKDKYVKVDACVISTSLADGIPKMIFGLSPAWEFPNDVVNLVFGYQKLDLNQAFHDLNYTKDSKLGNFRGTIGLLSKCRFDRKEFIKMAIHMAMINWDKICLDV